MSNSPTGEIKPNVYSSLKSWWNEFLDVIYPINCRTCYKKLSYQSIRSGYICKECWDTVQYIRPPYCLRCGHPSGDGFSEQCDYCKLLKTVNFKKARGVAQYSGVLRDAIHIWKYKYNDEVREPLILHMEHYIQSTHEFDENDEIIPVPLHPTKLRMREFNQAEILAEPIAQLLRIPILPDILYRTRNTRPQMELTALERLENVKGLFAVRENGFIQGKKIILVDDVMTTGATVNECSKVLMEAGSSEVNVLILARGT